MKKKRTGRQTSKRTEYLEVTSITSSIRMSSLHQWQRGGRRVPQLRYSMKQPLQDPRPSVDVEEWQADRTWIHGWPATSRPSVYVRPSVDVRSSVDVRPSMHPWMACHLQAIHGWPGSTVGPESHNIYDGRDGW